MRPVVTKFVRLANPLNVLRLIRFLFFRFGNWRRGRFKHFDFIIMRLPETMPPLPEPRGFLRRRVFGDSEMSLRDFDRHLRQIAHDPRPMGIVLFVSDFQMGLAGLQSVRDSLLAFRARGKRIICYSQQYNTATYYVASAADAMLMQPPGQLFTIGLYQTVTYQRDALAALGIKVDPVAITPYKSAAETLAQQTPSAEAQAQREWLLDSRFDTLINEIATERDVTPDAVRTMIDSAPHLDEAALDNGWIDGILNEEGIASHLGSADQPANLVPWEKAKRKLIRQWRKRPRKYVAVIQISGLIIPGESGSSPGGVPIPLPILGEDRAGDRTIVQQARQLMDDPAAAAVILYIDSRGGSAAASEAMASALDELAKTRPVIAYMHDAAASGGYYVATPAQWIVAQPGTITGSIGVITFKPVTSGTFEKLNMNRVHLSRGANADILSPDVPFSDVHREKIREGIEHAYNRFLDRVAESRGMTPEAVDAVGGGRVWTGAQALEHGLVDALGGFDKALEKARELAELPDDAPAVLAKSGKRTLAPKEAEAVNPAAGLRYLYDGVRHIYSAQPQMLLPFTVE